MFRLSIVTSPFLLGLFLVVAGCDGGLSGGLDVPVGSPDITIEQGDVIVQLDQNQNNTQEVGVDQNQQTDVEQGQDVNQEVDQVAGAIDGDGLPDLDCFTNEDCRGGAWCINGSCVGADCWSDADCDDGWFCNGVERCSGLACMPGPPPCAEDEVCDENTHECVIMGCHDDGDCDGGGGGGDGDGDGGGGGGLCTSDECIDGECVSTSIECAEGETCDPGTGECTRIGCMSDDECDDGEFCNGEETCDTNTGECVEGGSPCADGEACDEDANECSSSPSTYIKRHEGGSFGDTPIDETHYEVTVAPGEQIIGTIVVEAHYATPTAGAIVPIGWTVDWGSRENQPRLIDPNLPKNTLAILGISISAEDNLFAPSEPGDYHIVIAMAGRYTLDQVMSETKQDVPGAPVWYDGNDVGFDWTDTQFDQALFDGVVDSETLTQQGYVEGVIAATAVTVHVTPGDSQDAERILFMGTIEAGGQLDVFSINPDGSDLINLTTDFDDDAVFFHISPSGDRVAFGGMDAHAGVWVMNVDGSEKMQAVFLAGQPAVGADWLDDHTLVYGNPLSGCTNEVRVVDLDTGEDALLVPSPFMGQRRIGLDVSPDGTRLAISAQRGCWSPSFDVYVGDVACLRNDPSDPACGWALFADSGDDQMDRYARWSPDGETVYWSHDERPGIDTPKQIARKSVDSSASVGEYDAIVRGSCLDGDIDVCMKAFLGVSPDGSRVMFSSSDALYIWNPATGTTTMITSVFAVESAEWGVVSTGR